MGLWIVMALIIGTALILGLRAYARRSFLKQRVPSSLEDLHALVKHEVSFEVFSEVWAVLGKAYGIDPRLIHPSDTFLELNKADSWVLGKGEDDLGEWLDKKGLRRPPQLHKVLDLAKWVQSPLAVSAAR